MAYAVDTEVPVEKSRAEIERVLLKYGATQFAYMSNETGAMIGFVIRGKMVRFALPLPDRSDPKFRFTETKKLRRTDDETFKEWEQACRSRWRALYLCIRAKIEAIDSGITSFEAEFLAHFVIPGGQTFGDHAIPQIEEATKSGKMPVLSLGFGGGA